ncbi:MAG: biotin/lipoyl-containing protein, partial [Pseudomonadota bacterium]
ALKATEVAGSVTNVAFLARLAVHEGFARGEVDTGLIERDADALTAVPQAPPAARALAALAALGLPGKEGRGPWDRAGGFRLWGPARALVKIDDAVAAVDVEGERYAVTFDEETTNLAVVRAGDRLTVDDGARVFAARAVRHGETIVVFMDGFAHAFAAPDPLAVGGDAAGGGDLVLSPMPGLVKAMSAEAGAAVEAGAALCVLEAMKMEHTLKAPRAGVVASVGAAAGDQVEEGAILITLEPEDG